MVAAMTLLTTFEKWILDYSGIISGPFLTCTPKHSRYSKKVTQSQSTHKATRGESVEREV